MSDKQPKNIGSTFVVMAHDGSATPVEVTETFWQDLARQFTDFEGKTLVSRLSFDADWPTWERHSAGDEFVCLLSGAAEMRLVQDGVESSVSLKSAGQFVLVPRGAWHTAKIKEPTSMLFITPGKGTENVSVESYEPDRD